MKIYIIATLFLFHTTMPAGNKEIEYKIQVYTKQDRINFETQLKNNKLAQFKNKTTQKDCYLLSPHCVWDTSNGYLFTADSFRIRESDKGNFICVKTCFSQDMDKHSFRNEEETKIDNPKVLKYFLNAYCGEEQKEKIIKKTRTICLIGDFEIAFDDVKGLGEFIEIELKKTVSKEEGFKEIEDFLKNHGLTKFKLLTQSYFIMAMNPGYDFGSEKNL